MSAITLLGVVRELYVFGTQFIMINFAYIIATPIVCYFYLPVFFRLQKTSVYEVIHLIVVLRLVKFVSFYPEKLYSPNLKLSSFFFVVKKISFLIGFLKFTIQQYLELRFGYPTRLLASLAFSTQMILYMGIVVYAPALTIASVTGLKSPLL